MLALPRKGKNSVTLVPSRSFFHINTTEGWLLTGAALVVGWGIGLLLARWVNRLCDPPPHRRESRVTALLTAGLFALATFAVVFLESQRVSEVTPDLAWRFGRLVGHLGLLSLLIAATATDLRDFIIPDQITIPGLVIGVILATVSGDVQLIHFWVDWNHPLVALNGPEIPSWLGAHPHWHGLVWSLTGAVIGAGVTWQARSVSSMVLGQEAMGFGDVTLMAMIGSFLGWQPMLIVFMLAPFCGLFVGLAMKSLLNRPYIPYGPYLSAAAIVVMLSWRWIWTWEPTPRLSIRRLFGDLPSLAILSGASLLLLLILLTLVRWLRGGPHELDSD